MNDIKASMEYRGKLNGYLQSGVICEAGQDWIRMELHNHERELRAGVTKDLKRERRAEMKRARMVGIRAQGLRAKIMLLLSLIIAQSATREKGLGGNDDRVRRQAIRKMESNRN